MDCLVAAPSKLQRPAGDRVKTDARDAAHLARLLRLGEITAVRVPEREIEAVRDLVRAREDARADLMRVRHRLSKLLLRQGIVYSGGTPWTCVHEQWLRRHRFDDVHLKAAFDHSFDAVLAATAARDRLDEQIMVVAASPRFADPVNRLGCLRGISALTGLALTVEIGDWSRFSGSSIGAYVGLVPSEYSSGDSRGAGVDHQGRQYPCASAADRIGLASPQVLQHLWAHPAGPLGQGRPGASGSRARRQPAPQQAVAQLHRTRQEPTGRQRRHRPRTRRLVLVSGDHAISRPAPKLG